jgi:hypothetical protein
MFKRMDKKLDSNPAKIPPLQAIVPTNKTLIIEIEESGTKNRRK